MKITIEFELTAKQIEAMEIIADEAGFDKTELQEYFEDYVIRHVRYSRGESKHMIRHRQEKTTQDEILNVLHRLNKTLDKLSE